MAGMEKFIPRGTRRWRVGVNGKPRPYFLLEGQNMKTKFRDCPECFGSGKKFDEDDNEIDCECCDGTGEVEVNEPTLSERDQAMREDLGRDRL